MPRPKPARNGVLSRFWTRLALKRQL